MKKVLTLSLVLHIFVLISQTAPAFASNGRSAVTDSSCLEISGKVNCGSSRSSERITVFLLKDNAVIDSVRIAEGKVFRFTLDRNSFYTIRMSGKGYITRSVSINTDLPENILLDELCRFHFDTVLEPVTKKKKNEDAFDFPIALIAFDAKKEWFDYSRKYTSLVKKEMGTK